MPLQRILLASLALLLTFGTGLAQQAGRFISQWQGTIDGMATRR